MPSRYSKFPSIQPVRLIKPAVTDIQHTLKQFESIDTLALKYYNDPNLEWVIMSANPQYSLSFAIPAGTVLVVPFPLERVFRSWGENNEV